MKKLFAMVAIAVLILPVVLLDQTHAQSGRQQQQVWLKVTNTKTGAVHVTEWTLRAYQFEKNVSIDVPDFKVAKLTKVFGTDGFTFTFQKKNHVGSWLHFSVQLVGTPSIGKVLSIKFM